MSTAIEFNNVSKQYKLGLVSTKTLSHDLNRWWQTKILRKEDPYLKIGSVNDRSAKADSDYVWALKDIDFKVEQGDVVGIIGKNGAGKSTLLKLLSRVTNPTTGTIRARGRIASLLEVGTGFHPEMTGRENIYMNGSIMGMNKAEITRKLDEIVDFSGCERYIDTPVKRYSSGMTVRLGFAIAAHLDPEILVVDEVLAVGDAEFQKKAIGKMQDVSKGEGRTVLFVSHNMASIRQLCKTGVLLENGQMKFSGGINDTIDYYINGNINTIEDINHIKIHEINNYRISGDGTIHPIELIELKRDFNYSIDSSEVLKFHLKLKKNDNIQKIQICSLIDDVKTNNRVGLSCTDEIDITKLSKEFKVEVTINNHNLTQGQYIMNFWIAYGDIHSNMSYYDRVFNCLPFEIESINMKPVNMWYDSWGFSYFKDNSIKVVK